MTHALYLLRHGQTEWSANGQHTSYTDIPLTHVGCQQARQAGRTLAALRDGERPLVIASPRLRATHTAELAGLSINDRSETLSEWDYGDYEGSTTAQIRETVPGWTIWSHPVPGGETADHVAARADEILATVRSALAGTDIVLIGHGHFSRVLIARWINLPATEGVRFAFEPAAVTALGYERGQPQIAHLNITAH